MPRPERANLDRFGRLQFTRLGLRRRFGRDLYHWLRRASWPLLLLTIVGVYLTLNVAFACAYLGLGAQISSTDPGSFADTFFFSIQTMSTIGYGVMSPTDPVAEALVTVEAVVGMLATATATGLIFSKFATPTARIAFSRNLILRKYDGVPTLFMRLANERASFIVEARVQITFLRDEVSLEGEHMRRFHDLALARDASPIFAMGWTVMHPIDENSPLHGVTPEQLEEVDGAFLVSVSGIDETLSQTIHARHFYAHADVVWNARFADMISRLPDGKRAIDFAKLHEYEPLAEDAPELVVLQGESAVGE